MKIHRLILIAMLFITSYPLYAQTIKGKIVDADNQPLPYANVVLLSLPDSAFVIGTVSDEQGVFSLPAHKGDQLLRISSIGYATAYKLCDAPDLGIIRLESDAQLLGEVVVKAELPVTRVKDNALITRVTGSLLSRVGTGSDVIRRIPGLSMDGNKNIEVFGKGTPLIYINGRKVRDNAELEQLSSGEIESVELITNPGAEYDAEVKAVLKIKTVKPVGEGLGGYVYADGGYAEAWNLSEQVKLNYRKGGFDVFGSVMHTDEANKQHESLTQTMHGDHLWYLSDEADIEGRYKGLSAQAGMNLQFGEHHSAGMMYELKRMPYLTSGTMDQTYDVTRDGENYDRMNSQMDAYKHATTHKLNAYYTGKLFDKLSLDFNFDYLYGKNYSKQVSDENSTTEADRTVTSIGTADYHLYAAKLVLAYPLGKGNLRFGAEWNRTDHTDTYVNPENIVADSDTRSEENKAAVFAEYGIAWGKTSLNAGVRYEHTAYDYFIGGVRADDECRTYDNVFPTLSLSFPIKHVSSSLSYTMKTLRPTYTQLDGSVQYSNRYMYRKGNPLLSPQQMHDVTWMLGYRFLNVSLAYQYIKDYIDSERSLYNQEGSTSLQTYVNFKKNQQLSLLVSLSPVVGCWHPVASAYVCQPFFETQVFGKTQKHNNPMATFTLNNDFVLPKDFVLTLNMDFTTAGNIGIIQRYNYGTLNAGIRKDLLNKRLTLNLQGMDLLDTFRQKGVQYSPLIVNTYEDTYNFRQVKLTVTYRFNMTKSKYKGTGAANEEIRRL